MESQLGSFKSYCCNKFVYAKEKSKGVSSLPIISGTKFAGIMKSCLPRTTSCKDNHLQQQSLPHIKLGITYQANDGDRFTSNSQGFRVSSIRTSKPYSSENTADTVSSPYCIFKQQVRSS